MGTAVIWIPRSLFKRIFGPCQIARCGLYQNRTDHLDFIVASYYGGRDAMTHLYFHTWRGHGGYSARADLNSGRGVEYLRVPMYRQNKSRIRIGHCCFVVRGLQLSDWPEAVGGLLYQLAANLLQRLHIDDPVNAFPEPLLNNFALTPAEWVCELADIDADTDAAGHAAAAAACGCCCCGCCCWWWCCCCWCCCYCWWWWWCWKGRIHLRMMATMVIEH